MTATQDQARRKTPGRHVNPIEDIECGRCGHVGMRFHGNGGHGAKKVPVYKCVKCQRRTQNPLAPDRPASRPTFVPDYYVPFTYHNIRPERLAMHNRLLRRRWV